MKDKLMYWIPTALVVLAMGGSGVMDLVGVEDAKAIIRHLGYPDYFCTLLGTAKLLGVVGLLAPVPRTLREWAYAGFTFDALAAVVSHLASGDGVSNVVAPVVVLALLWTSLWQWRRGVGLAPSPAMA